MSAFVASGRSQVRVTHVWWESQIWSKSQSLPWMQPGWQRGNDGSPEKVQESEQLCWSISEQEIVMVLLGADSCI
jgi:hypothetical protein